MQATINQFFQNTFSENFVSTFLTILTHLANHKILSDAQHGFIKRRSCDAQLLLALNDFARGLEDKSQTVIILLDFAKAIDKASHHGLLKKPITMVYVDIPLNG